MAPRKESSCDPARTAGELRDRSRQSGTLSPGPSKVETDLVMLRVSLESVLRDESLTRFGE